MTSSRFPSLSFPSLLRFPSPIRLSYIRLSSRFLSLRPFSFRFISFRFISFVATATAVYSLRVRFPLVVPEQGSVAATIFASPRRQVHVARVQQEVRAQRAVWEIPSAPVVADGGEPAEGRCGDDALPSADLMMMHARPSVLRRRFPLLLSVVLCHHAQTAVPP